MLSLKDKLECCGCTACFSICPKKCIIMKSDKEGFLYPEADILKCIGCGLCERVCPTHNIQTNEKHLNIYAAINRNEDIRMRSSSGGIFILLAETIIDKGGVVFGARFDNNWNVVHDYTEDKEGLSLFMGSKYVQSSIGNTYSQVKIFLDKGREVLFSGTPCQIVGLKKFLFKQYNNLITVDFVCHGVPSPLVWKKYLSESIKKVYGNLYDEKKSDIGDFIKHISFRSKEKGWKNYHICIEYFNGLKDLIPSSKNLYMNVFLSDLSLRPSCYYCPAKFIHSQSDVTLADFWGVDRIDPNIDDDRGCSLLFINNNKIKDYVFSLNVYLKLQKFEDIFKYNKSILLSVNQPVNRNFFFKVLNILSFNKAYIFTTSRFLLYRLIRYIYRL